MRVEERERTLEGHKRPIPLKKWDFYLVCGRFGWGERKGVRIPNRKNNVRTRGKTCPRQA